MVPPATTRAPAPTASLSISRARSSCRALIIGPSPTSSVTVLPTVMASARAASPLR